MIKFKKIRWKNFLSTGDHWTEINFLEKNTNLIIGHNGSGKSTLLDALTFVLFNKPFRKINKSQLVNTVNERECLVELEFDVNARDYVVRRGIRPNTFDIEVNGSPLHRQADDRSNQKILEDNIVDRINEMDLNIQYIYRRVKELEKKEEEKSNGWLFS